MDGTRGGITGEPVTWRVEGMDCASCVAKVEKAVSRLPGVTDIKVNLMAERLGATLSPDGATPDVVEKQISALDYKATRVEAPPHQAPAVAGPISWRVEGMDCASCVARTGQGFLPAEGRCLLAWSAVRSTRIARAGHGPMDGAVCRSQGCPVRIREMCLSFV